MNASEEVPLDETGPLATPTKLLKTIKDQDWGLLKWLRAGEGRARQGQLDDELVAAALQTKSAQARAKKRKKQKGSPRKRKNHT